MAIKTYQLYGSASATASAVATVTIRRDCEILAVVASMGVDMVADNSRAIAALSVNPTTQIGTNDGMGSLVQLDTLGNLVTSGFLAGSVNCGYLIPNVPLRTNDVLYLHMSITTATAQCNFIIYVREK